MVSEIIYDDDDGEARVRIYFARSESGGYLTETVNGGESNRFYLPESALSALLARDDARIARLEDVANAVRTYLTEEGHYPWPEVQAEPDSLIGSLRALDADAPGGG